MKWMDAHKDVHQDAHPDATSIAKHQVMMMMMHKYKCIISIDFLHFVERRGPNWHLRCQCRVRSTLRGEQPMVVPLLGAEGATTLAPPVRVNPQKGGV